MPSLRLDESSNIAAFSLDDFKRLIAFALEGVVVDEDWYISRYSDVREASESRGSKSYATEHYLTHGFLEGRLPHDPVVDEAWYRETYPDVDEAIRQGREVSAKSHFIEQGYHEGRKPAPDPRTRHPKRTGPHCSSRRSDTVGPRRRAFVVTAPETSVPAASRQAVQKRHQFLGLRVHIKAGAMCSGQIAKTRRSKFL